MRADKDLLIFFTHTDWYTEEHGIGYVPTDKAPKEAIEAMKRVNIRLKRDYEFMNKDE